MGQNKKQSLIFTTMMCALMVLGMSIYNVLLNEGLSIQLWRSVVLGYIPAFVVALFLDLFIVGKLAKSLANKLVPTSGISLKKIMVISCLMVSGMVLLMSLYGAVLHVGFTSQLPKAYLTSVWTNFVCALPLQLLIVGPSTRKLFTKLFPPRYALGA
jgi:hypothetical protein